MLELQIVVLTVVFKRISQRESGENMNSLCHKCLNKITGTIGYFAILERTHTWNCPMKKI